MGVDTTSPSITEPDRKWAIGARFEPRLDHLFGAPKELFPRWCEEEGVKQITIKNSAQRYEILFKTDLEPRGL